jgi:hypothetical protein
VNPVKTLTPALGRFPQEAEINPSANQSHIAPVNS